MKKVYYYYPEPDEIPAETTFLVMPFRREMVNFKFPSGLVELHIIDIENDMQNGIEYIPSCVNDDFYRNFPPTLKILNINTCHIMLKKIPDHIEKLTIEQHFTFEDLPKNLKSLIIYHFDDFDYRKLPKSIKHLELSIEDENTIENLPEGLETLGLDFLDEVKFPKIPLSVQFLKIKGNYQTIKEELPRIKRLELNSVNFNLDFLPPTLEELQIKRYEGEINTFMFPSSLKKLTLIKCSGEITINPELDVIKIY